jgi:hypothetical protein
VTIFNLAKEQEGDEDREAIPTMRLCPIVQLESQSNSILFLLHEQVAGNAAGENDCGKGTTRITEW